MKCENCGKYIKFDKKRKKHWCRVCKGTDRKRMPSETLKHLKIIREQKKGSAQNVMQKVAGTKRAGKIEQANQQKKREIRKGLTGEQTFEHFVRNAIGGEKFKWKLKKNLI